MPKGLKRYYGTGDLHFITCTCYRRNPWFDTGRRFETELQSAGDFIDSDDRGRFGFCGRTAAGCPAPCVFCKGRVCASHHILRRPTPLTM